MSPLRHTPLPRALCRAASLCMGGREENKEGREWNGGERVGKGVEWTKGRKGGRKEWKEREGGREGGSEGAREGEREDLDGDHGNALGDMEPGGPAGEGDGVDERVLRDVVADLRPASRHHVDQPLRAPRHVKARADADQACVEHVQTRRQQARRVRRDVLDCSEHVVVGFGSAGDEMR
eukprot:3437502-Rhodomonas_salina.3